MSNYNLQPQLPQKPSAGNFKQTVLSAAWWSRLWAYLKALRPLVPDNISTFLLPNGQLAARLPKSTATGGASGSEYNGQFKLVASDTAGSVKVINGNDPDDMNCGYVDIGGESYPVTAFDAAANGYVYLEITYNSAWVLTMKSSSTYPTSDNTKKCFVFGTVNAGGEIVQLWQPSDDGHATINDRWV